MNAEMVNENPSNIIYELMEIIQKSELTFGSLTPEQINWKPSADSWSVGQCFEHWIKINSGYFPEFEALIKGRKKPSFWEKYSPLSGLFGNLLFKSLSPEAKRKLKAPEAAAPSASSISPAIIKDFLHHQPN